MLKNPSPSTRTLIGILAITTIALPTQAFAALSASSTKAQVDAAYSAPQQQAASAMTTSALTADTRSCETWYFGTLGSKCLRYSNLTTGVGYTGAMGN